jgi:hypothetical protein
MIFLFGTRNYGKVDQVPGLFYLSTRFAHFNFVPLFPIETHLIMDGSESGNGFRGVKLGMSGKSVIFAYLRAIAMLGGLAACAFGIIRLVERNPIEGGVMLAAGVVAILFFILSYKLSKPSPHRALRLAEQAGIAPETVAQFFVGSGLLPEHADADIHDDHYASRKSNY